jgi:hypothetical protein
LLFIHDPNKLANNEPPIKANGKNGNIRIIPIQEMLPSNQLFINCVNGSTIRKITRNNFCVFESKEKLAIFLLKIYQLRHLPSGKILCLIVVVLA